MVSINIDRDKMPSKKPRTCPICHHPSVTNLGQHLYGVHGINGQERKQLLLQGKVTSEANKPNPDLRHASFLDMLQREERPRL